MFSQAKAEMDSIAQNLAYREADKAVGITLVSMKEDIVGNVQPFLIVLLAAVGFLLLIACANVAWSEADLADWSRFLASGCCSSARMLRFVVYVPH